MTPQERALVSDLFDRLAPLERAPRDPDAERTIREGLSRAPNATYALVQTVLVQDEALKLADARIAELEEALAHGGAPERREERGFLDTMRDSLFGREERRGSVPSAGNRGAMGVPPGFGGERRYGDEQPGSPWRGQAAPPMQAGMAQGGRGGSFLGTAAAVAAGAIGGGLLMNSMQGLFSGQKDGPFAGAFDKLSGKDAGAGELGRDAGLSDVNSGGRASFADTQQGDQSGSGGWEQASADDADFIGDDFDDGGGFDGDYA
jgi:uncharacterized protein